MTNVARLLNCPGNSDKLTHREPWCTWSEVQAEPLHGPQLNLEEGFDLINTGERPSNCLGEGKTIWVEEMGALQWDYKYKAPLSHMWSDTEKILGYSRSMLTNFEAHLNVWNRSSILSKPRKSSAWTDKFWRFRSPLPKPEPKLRILVGYISAE